MSTLRAVYTNLVAARTTIRDMRRFRQIASVMVRHGFGFLFSRFSRRDPEVAKAVEAALENAPVSPEADEVPPAAHPSQALAIRFRHAIEDLGPTFIKFGQILSTRPDLIPKVFSDELEGLQDDVAPMLFEDVRAVIEAELGQGPEEIFATFEEVPLAAASIAQVHRATLPTGELVAVKIQRSGIRDVIEADLDILHYLARQLITAIPEAALFQPVGIVQEFERAIRKELDFGGEARNIERFTRNFRDVDYIHIPKIYRQYCTTRVLTMEFVEGVKITDAVDRGLGDPDILAKRTLWSLFLQFFRHGFFHGDLHPGNILVLPENRICYLDFGLAGRITPEMRDRLVDMLFAVGRRDFEQLGRLIYEIGERDAPVDYDAFLGDVFEIGERYFEDTPLAEIDVGELFQELVRGAMRHRMRMPPTYTMMIKALMTIEGLGKRLAPDMDLVAEAQPFITELIKDRYSPERLWKRTTEFLFTSNRLLRRIPPALTRILEDIDAGRVKVQVELSNLEPYLQDRRRSDSMWALGLVFATFSLSATLALSWDEWRILGIPALSFVGYLLAIPVGAMFWRAWWRR